MARAMVAVRSGSGLVEVRLRREAFPELIRYPPPGDLQQPTFEGAAGRIVVEPLRPSCDGKQRLLDRIVRLRLGEARPGGRSRR